MPTQAELVRLLSRLRVRPQAAEYDLHRMAAECLAENGLDAAHEVRLGPRCRIDLVCGRTGIEFKRGKPSAAVLLRQLRRYAESEQLDGLIVICERSVDLPREICGKPLSLICLNRLWGITV